MKYSMEFEYCEISSGQIGYIAELWINFLNVENDVPVNIFTQITHLKEC